MEEISYRKLKKEDVGFFIKMRIYQLKEEGAEKPPYYSNPTGKIGLLSSMYTLKEYRRKGIAGALLEKIVEEARSSGCGMIQITASDMGVLLYSNFGFQKNGNFMQYILHK